MKIVLLVLLAATCIAQDRDGDESPIEREQWFYNRRALPTGQIPIGARVKALAEIERIDRATRSSRNMAPVQALIPVAEALETATWTSIGPRPTDPGAALTTSGRVTAIAIDPRDNNTVYLGAATGGVWKTTDGGKNWRPLGDDQVSLSIGSIALDPKNPDIVYAGTGEANFSDNNYYGAGILKSVNGGASWTNIQGPFLHAYIGGLGVSPTDSQVVLCSAGNTFTPSTTGIWRSSDGGATWNRVLTGVGTAVLFDPTNGNIAYAALGNIVGASSNGVYRSTDGGRTWSALRGSGANALPLASAGRIALAIAPSTPTTLYSAIEDFKTGFLLDVYKSTDSGANWNPANAPNICVGSRGLKGQCGYDLAITVHPKDPNIVFAVGDHVNARTLDGGATWSMLPFTGPNGVRFHVDEHVLTYTPDGTRLYLGNDGGVWSSSNSQASQAAQINWTELNDTLSITQFYPGFAIHPTDANRSLGGTQDNGTQLFTGSSIWANVVCGDSGYNAFDSAVPSIAFSVCTSKDLPVIINRSTDSGKTWTAAQYGVDVTELSDFIPPLVVDPSDSRNVFYGTYRVWLSRDSGGKFTPISPDLGGGSAHLSAIAISPSDHNTVYAGASSFSPSLPLSGSATKVRVSNNALSASPAWNDRSNGLPPRVITHIAVDPIDSVTAYITFSGFAGGSDTQGHVFKTTNSGANWMDVSGNLPNLPVNDLVIDPDLPSTLYIATDLGVMMSASGGATWSSLGTGLPKVVVQSLVLHRGARILRAATYGRGAWDIAVPLSSRSLQPALAALNPSVVNAGGSAFLLQVTGSNLVTGTVLRWNGSARPTTIIDGTHLTASISAADIVRVGRASIDVFNPSQSAGVSNALLLAIGPAPASSSQAFVNAAYPTGGNALAPGSIATLFGTNLAPDTVMADQAPPLPRSLGGTSLGISPISLPIFFVSPGQVNFQVPWYSNLTGPITTTLTVTQGTLTTPIRVTIRPFSPGMFTTNSQGTGQASALIASTASIAAPVGTFPGSRPAKRGEYVSLFCTGLGEVTNRPADGAPSPSDPLSITTATPLVNIGGVNATVTFSGLAPNFVGLYQVNVQVPSNTPVGNTVPVLLSMGGVAANQVMIAVE